MPDPQLAALTALRRLRHAETDAARRSLGETLAQEMALAAQEGEIAQKLAEARQFSGDFDREAFAAWFGRVRAERARLAAAMREAASNTEKAQTALAQRRVAETAAEEAVARAVAAQQAALARREQVTLEDAARAVQGTANQTSGRKL